MPHPDAPPLTRWVVLRAVGFAIAIALGAVAVWLIVIADSTKSMRLGVLAGIWGALLGAYAMFGARRHALDADESARSVSDVPVLSAQEIALRSSNDVERVAEAAARRAFEDRLEQMLRREIGREVSDLRSEIARLRQDLLDKVGGQLRLERIETTRVIGSDLEALQHEVRQLKQASETGALHDFGLGTSSVRTIVEPATVRPVSRPSAEVAADIKPARVADESPVVDVPVVDGPDAAETPRAETPQQPTPPAAWSPPAVSRNGAAPNGATRHPAERTESSAPEPAETTGPIQLEPPDGAVRPEAPSTAARSTGRPAGPATPEPWQPVEAWIPPVPPAREQPSDRTAAAGPPEPAEPTQAAAPPASPQPAAAPAPSMHPSSEDPFASLPRLTPFTEFELDPVDTSTPVHDPRPAASTGAAAPVVPANPAYTGRRRRTDGDDPDAGRHSRSEPAAAAPDAGGGRRRRTDEDDVEDDLLSRLLARGSAER